MCGSAAVDTVHKISDRESVRPMRDHWMVSQSMEWTKTPENIDWDLALLSSLQFEKRNKPQQSSRVVSQDYVVRGKM